MGTINHILDRVIQQATKGYANYQVEPFVLSVEHENEQTIVRPAILTEINPVKQDNHKQVSAGVDLGNDKLVLTSKDVDLPITATLSLESHNNLFAATRAEYMMMTFNKYQVFENYLKVRVRNYGVFVPFQIEFLRITPSN